jgi:putative spermidine/putrescine transport system permease protein
MSTRSPRLLLPFVVAAYLALLAPLVVVIAVSFGPSAVFEFPPRGLTLHWFEAFFASSAFVTAFFRVSLVVGLLAAALATVLGTSAALGLVRFRFFGREAVEPFFSCATARAGNSAGRGVVPILCATVVQASIWTLLCGHLVICTPYVIRSVTAGLVGLDPRLEEAAMSLGATRVQALFKVTVPLLRSSLLSGAIFAFIISFSDINLALFLSGPQSTSLPVHIFSQIQWQGDPTIAAASSMQIVIIGLLSLVGRITQQVHDHRQPWPGSRNSIDRRGYTHRQPGSRLPNVRVALCARCPHSASGHPQHVDRVAVSFAAVLQPKPRAN